MSESNTRNIAAESAAGTDQAETDIDSELLENVSGGLRRARTIGMDDEFRQLPS